VHALSDRFAARFGGESTIYSAPGRVNLIGEHTDYNDGFVMPIAIDRSTYVAVARRPDRRLVVHSATIDKTADASLDALAPQKRWSDYVFGVGAMLLSHGVPVDGANMLIDSDVPLGAGLSSSAALEVAVARALLGVSGHDLGRSDLAKLCQRAENEFVGARCGIMDQFVSLHGAPGHALLLDCRSLDYSLIPLPSDLRVVVCNSMVRHSVAAGEYNARRADCEAAARALAIAAPHVRALRDVTAADLDRHRDLLTARQLRRARHVVSENARVLAMGPALSRGDIDTIGRVMHESHESLRTDFDVSCGELDLLVQLAADVPGARGARMTGGGFGGCTVNLVAAEAVTEFSTTIAARYQHRMNVRPDVYPV
jgi:galactokinase